MSFGIPVRNGLGVGLLASTFLSTLRIGGRPAMSLDFIGTNSLDSRVTFTRATTATFVGSNGLTQTAAIDAPRFDYDPATLAPKGLLIEEARTNLLLASEDITAASWLTAFINTRTANTTTSPTGTVTADTLTEDTSNNRHIIYQTPTLAASGVYTFSIFLKQSTGRYAQVQLAAVGGSYGVVVDLTTGVVTSTNTGVGTTNQSSSVVSYGNGWYRISVSCQSAIGTVYPIVAGSNSATPTYDANGNPTYTGTGQSWFVWGAQLEAGSFATSYIPTVASTVTRSADVATMTGTNFSSWYNQNAGTFVTQASTYVSGAVNGNQYLLSASDNTITNRITMFRSTLGTNFSSRVTVGGVAANPGNVDIFTTNTLVKCATAASAGSNNVISAGAGTLSSAATTASMPVVTQLSIGTNETLNGSFLNGHFRQIAYYNTRLPNATLQVLTI